MNKNRSFYFWTRKLHLYLGLFIGPHVLIFALSTLYLNHGWRPGAAGRKRTVPVEVTEGLDRIEQAKRILENMHTHNGMRIVFNEPGPVRDWGMTRIWTFFMDALCVGLVLWCSAQCTCGTSSDRG
jgi:hypothetical protein